MISSSSVVGIEASHGASTEENYDKKKHPLTTSDDFHKNASTSVKDFIKVFRKEFEDQDNTPTAPKCNVQKSKRRYSDTLHKQLCLLLEIVQDLVLLIPLKTSSKEDDTILRDSFPQVPSHSVLKQIEHLFTRLQNKPVNLSKDKNRNKPNQVKEHGFTIQQQQQEVQVNVNWEQAYYQILQFFEFNHYAYMERLKNQMEELDLIVDSEEEGEPSEHEDYSSNDDDTLKDDCSSTSSSDPEWVTAAEFELERMELERKENDGEDDETSLDADRNDEMQFHDARV